MRGFEIPISRPCAWPPRSGGLRPFMTVLKTITLGSAAGDGARVVAQEIFQMAEIFGIADAGRIRIGTKAVDRKRADRAAIVGVEIHVLVESVGIEEIIAHPAARKIVKRGGIKINGD